MLRTTIGNLLINESLPKDLRDYGRVLDKKTVTKLLTEVAQKYPDRYRDISHRLATLGWQSAQNTGGSSFGLASLRKSKAARTIEAELKQQVAEILRSEPDEKKRDEKILQVAAGFMSRQQDEIFNESVEENNPLATQIVSGARGNKMFLTSLRGGDMLYVDHRDRPIPFLVTRSYSQGLSPAQYWAGAYGARKGVVDVKSGVRDAGYLSKQFAQVAHRLLITDHEDPDDGKPGRTLRGLPVSTDDADNEGALLAAPAGRYGRNTVLTPKIIAELKDNGIDRILVRSPVAAGSPDNGIYARDAGVREFGRLPVKGENVAMSAVNALSEPVSQGTLSSKHSGGVAGAAASKAVSVFDTINALVNVPKTFPGVAAHADRDGLVTGIEDAPAGGKFIHIDGHKQYVLPGFEVRVQRGDRVEAGDILSDGVPNPAIITKYKGIGEGRRYFVNTAYKTFKEAGLTAHRRNIELLARGLIDHVRITDEYGDNVPDDIVPYHVIEHEYQPRAGFRTQKPSEAVGRYLERPYLHYTIGTRLRPSMLKDFEQFGVQSVDVHDEPPPFEAHMVRSSANLHHDPDWMTRMYGSGLKGSLLDAVHRGGTSSATGTSFVHGLARAENFGEVGKVVTPKVTEHKIDILS